MRFMLFMLPNIEPTGDWMPSAEDVAVMTKYNNALVEAGVLLEGSGLHPQTEGVRVAFAADGRGTIIDGPFTEAKEAIGGFWVLQTKTREEAVEWASRVPGKGCTVELRQIMEMAEFPPDVQAAAGVLPDA